MMFDNTPPPQPTRAQQVKAHLPILAVVGGIFVLFVSLHTAAVAVAIGAGAHIVIGAAALLGGRWLGRRRGESSADEASR